jgi:hypothetical protein
VLFFELFPLVFMIAAGIIVIVLVAMNNGSEE